MAMQYDTPHYEFDVGDDDNHDDHGHRFHQENHDNLGNDESDIILVVVNLADAKITHLGESSRNLPIEHDHVHVQHGSPTPFSSGPHVIPPPTSSPPQILGGLSMPSPVPMPPSA